jgi:hypothetical protein
MVTKARSEKLKWRTEQRRQPSQWGNTSRNWVTELKDGSPISDLILQDAGIMFRRNCDTQKTKGIYWNNSFSLRMGHDSILESAAEEGYSVYQGN